MSPVRRRAAASLALGLLGCFALAPAHLPGLEGHDHAGAAHPATAEHSHSHSHEDGHHHEAPDHPGHECQCPDTPVLQPSAGAHVAVALGEAPPTGSLPVFLGSALQVGDSTLLRRICAAEQRPPPRSAMIRFGIRRL